MVRRLAIGLVAVICCLTFGWLFGRAIDYEFTEMDRRDCLARPIEGTPCDSDGRLHPCGWVTEDGVTEHLNAYIERCGDVTLGSDTP